MIKRTIKNEQEKGPKRVTNNEKEIDKKASEREKENESEGESKNDKESESP